MPVVVVAMAAGSFAAGATAFAAATTTLGMIAAGASMVGAAMTIVGTVTGNEKLTKWGAIIGIAGNIGTGLINSAAQEGAKAAATAGADAVTGAATDAAASVAGDVAADAAADVAASTAGDAIGAGMQTFPVAAPPPAAAIPMDAGGMLGSAPIGEAAKSVADAAGAAAPQAASAAKAASSSMDVFDVGNTAVGRAAEGAGKVFDAGQTAVGQAGQIAGNADISAYIPGGIPDGAGTGMLGSIGRGMNSMQAWAKANPELAKAALNGVSTMAGNLAPSAKDKAMMEQYRMQNALAKQQTETAATRLRWGSGRI